MSTFEAAITVLLEHEGGRLIADDHGRGPSKWGVTLATAREIHPEWNGGDIARLTAERAAEFYRAQFWERYRIGLIDDQALATKLLDLAVNVGPGTAIKILQRSVGTAVDGALGPKTAEAANGLPAAEVLAEVRELAAAHYRQLAEEHPNLAACLPGWLARLKA
ncbi:MAG: glycosyl hydrolase 108 family protein [Bryobacteraceae bacterium]